MIRKAKPADINAIVDLHLENLKDGLLFLFGRKILVLFYEEVIASKDCFIFLYDDNNRITGVAASAANAESIFSTFKSKYFLKLFLELFGVLAFRPLLLFKIISPGSYPLYPTEELMMLFVDQNNRTKGVGSKLVGQTVQEFRKNGVKSFKISILSKNYNGMKFYEKYGFKSKGDFIYFGERRVLYLYEL